MDKEIILKAWETFQGLAAGLGDSCWKIRSVYYTAASALLAYAFVHSATILYAFVIGLSLVFFVLESGYKQVQDQFISKSLAIERTLNDLLVEESDPFIPEGGISTSVTTPTIKKCFTTLKYRNWFFWLPYAVIPLVSLSMWLVGMEAHEDTPKVALVTDSSIDTKGRNPSVHSVPISRWSEELARIADSVGDIAGLAKTLQQRAGTSTSSPTPAPSASPSPTPTPTPSPSRNPTAATHSPPVGR
jgi:hypothetical protein